MARHCPYRGGTTSTDDSQHLTFNIVGVFSWRRFHWQMGLSLILLKWQLSVKTLLRSVRSYHILVIQFSGWRQTTLAHACVLRA